MSNNNKSLILIVGLIPLMQIMLILGFFIRAIVLKSPMDLLCFFFSIYLLPPIMWRLLSPMIPTKMGPSYLGVHTDSVNGWFVSYQIQQIYNAVPTFEAVLKLIPGLYSAWLRLWGASIGKKINWTCQSKIVDRPFVHIGDRCLVGNESYLSAHAIKKKGDRYLLYLKEVRIGSDVVLSFRSVVAPGAIIGNRAFIEAGAAVMANVKIEEGMVHERV